MAYQQKTYRSTRLHKGLGAQLGRLATRKGMSVIEISRITGASRPTVYRWFYGCGVSPAYERAVTRLIARLSK